MIDADFADGFARAWVRAWNDHDLQTILSHYADDVVLHSPRIRIVTGEDLDFVEGKAALENYWRKALGQARDLFFEIDQVLAGSDALTILYANQRQQNVAETFIFNAERKVARSIATYG